MCELGQDGKRVDRSVAERHMCMQFILVGMCINEDHQHGELIVLDWNCIPEKSSLNMTTVADAGWQFVKSRQPTEPNHRYFCVC